jgi:hypothetical protein
MLDVSLSDNFQISLSILTVSLGDIKEMESGDTVFFHPLLIHGSGMNRTEDFRKVYYI